MNQVIRDVSLKNECSLFRKEVNNTTFINCIFDHLILNDIKIENAEFVRCRFDHVFIESFSAKRVLISNSKISSLSLRGNRKITGKRLFSAIKERKIEEIKFNDNEIDELVLGGNLQIINCQFPMGDNYLHIENPYLIYKKCEEHITTQWEGERRKIGLHAINTFYLDKEVDKQNKDFVIRPSYDIYLDKEANEILMSVFQLLKQISGSGGR